MLKKGVYVDEYIDPWQRFNETSLLAKKGLWSKVMIKYIVDEGYKYAKIIWKDSFR